MNVVKNYIRGGVLVEDLSEGKTVRQHYGVVLSVLVAYHENNFEHPVSEQTTGVMVKFKHGHFYHKYANFFPVNWEDIYLPINL
jgi:hypothetical protein